MSVASHLGIQVRHYDRLIRTFIPHYKEMLQAAAEAAAGGANGPAPVILDLGMGTGALSEQCLRLLPDARVIGVDEDETMLALAHRRLGRRVTSVTGDFTRVPLPRCDVATASLALHHVASPLRKRHLYARIFKALRRGGMFVNADCAIATSPVLREQSRAAWLTHLRKAYSRAEAEGLLRAWGREDTYYPLEREHEWLRSAGFDVDVVWRRGSFAVLAGRKRA